MMAMAEHDVRSALTDEAPFLVEKLLKEHIMETEDEGEALALPALEFLTRTPTFFARELPGELTDEEKLGLVSAFVEHGLLRVAA